LDGFYIDEDDGFQSVLHKLCLECRFEGLEAGCREDVIADWATQYGAKVDHKTIIGGTRDEILGWETWVTLDGETYELVWDRDVGPNRSDFLRWLRERPSIPGLPPEIRGEVAS
jgi:hypothetical protein